MKQEFIAAICLTAIGLLLLIAPRFVWKIAESWKNNEKDEPSTAYIVVVRCVGAVAVVTAIIVAIQGL